MRSNLAFIAQRRSSNLEESATDVLLEWVEFPTGMTRDEVTGEMPADAAGAARAEVVKGFVHFPEPNANSVVRQFNEVEAGDMILDLHPETVVDGRSKLTFMLLRKDGRPVDGSKWTAKPISESLARVWSPVAQGEALWRTVLLRKET